MKYLLNQLTQKKYVYFIVGIIIYVLMLYFAVLLIHCFFLIL